MAINETLDIHRKKDLTCKVLIVDDEQELLLSIQTGFEYNERFQVLTAGNGKEALKVMGDHKIDLVVTDLKMPEMDGVELLAVMSEKFPEVPTIVMTAFGTEVIEQQLVKAGTLSTLDKPLDIDALDEAINKALDCSRKQDGTLAGISLGNFLQLITMEGKTAQINVFHHGGQRAGSLFFQDGQLLDGTYLDINGDKAVLEMLSWENVRIAIDDMSVPFPEPALKHDLIYLILESARLKDESNDANPLDEVKKEFNRIQEQQAREEQERREREKREEEERKERERIKQERIERDKKAEEERREREQLEQKRIEQEKKAKEEQDKLKQQHKAQPTFTGGEAMAGLKDLLKEMADEMDGVLAIQITGMDGITIAMHNPTGTDVDAISAKFAMIMKMVDKSVEALQGMGDFEENLVQSQNAWILTRFINPQYYVGIAVSRDGTLGNVRLVAQRYLDQLRRSL